MNIIVRPAVIEDADLIVYFVKQLAIFEKHDPSLVRLTPVSYTHLRAHET